MKRLTNELCKDDVLDTKKEPRLKSQAEIWLRLCQIEDILGDTYDLDRLREIVNACNLIGKKVYINQWWHGGIRINNPPIEKTVYNVLISQRKGALLQFKDGAFHTSYLGKKIFTSKEAAEAALAKEVQNNG